MTKSYEKHEQFQANLRTAERLLSRRDPQLRPVIRRHGPCALAPQSKYFELLVASIISQQLSTKVADVIFKRFTDVFPGRRFPMPEEILAVPDEILRATGMSYGKVSFIKDLAAKTADRTIVLSKIARMEDDEVTEMLTQVKGIGVWTVHMFLIFSLGRLDVLPVGDLGIRKGVQLIYELDHLPVADEIEELAERNRWRPYCSVASWYLWRGLE